MNKEEIERILQRLNLGSELTPNEFCYLKEYIKEVQKKAELGEHYKHLYQDIKKQKDDVVELIKKRIKENEGHINARMETHYYYMMLRMLGEIK